MVFDCGFNECSHLPKNASCFEAERIWGASLQPLLNIFDSVIDYKTVIIWNGPLAVSSHRDVIRHHSRWLRHQIDRRFGHTNNIKFYDWSELFREYPLLNADGSRNIAMFDDNIHLAHRGLTCCKRRWTFDEPLLKLVEVRFSSDIYRHQRRRRRGRRQN